MTRARRPLRVGARRAGLAACALLALSALPVGMFPWPWLAALLGPAMLAIPLGRTRLGSFERITVLAALQAGALFASLHVAGPLHRLAALAATLLPPMAFLAVRAEPLDVLRGVFVSFCLLLIGAILGEPSAAQLLGFVAIAVLTLQADVAATAAEDRASARSDVPARWRRIGAASTVVSACLATFLLVLHGLRALPAPGDEDPATARAASAANSDRGAARVGPSADFDFGNVPGSLLTLRASQLVRVASADGHPVPPDLYLRCAQFDVAGLDRWGTRRARFRDLPDGAAGVAVGPEHADRIARRLRVDLLETSTGLAYVPPGTFRIVDGDGLAADLRAGVFRYREPPSPPAGYEVAFHPIRADAIDELPDARLAGLTEIGNDLRPWRHVFERILAEPAVRREIDPIRVAGAIAAALHARCSYALREPAGPHRHSLLNFLEGNREGFCMHFASVTAICLRLAGIPARIGVGLLGGDPAEGELGVRVYGAHNAHAWVEIPFAGIGWVVFDPTPPAARENLRWIDFGAEAAPADVADTPTDDTPRPRLSIAGLDRTWPWVALIVGAAVVVGFRRPRHRRGDGAAADRMPADARTARRLLENVLADLAARGLTRAPGETLERFASRLRALGVGGAPLRDAFAAYQEVRFGGQPFDAARRARLERPTAR